jgi:hypothetical protein
VGQLGHHDGHGQVQQGARFGGGGRRGGSGHGGAAGKKQSSIPARPTPAKAPDGICRARPATAPHAGL